MNFNFWWLETILPSSYFSSHVAVQHESLSYKGSKKAFLIHKLKTKRGKKNLKMKKTNGTSAGRRKIQAKTTRIFQLYKTGVFNATSR